MSARWLTIGALAIGVLVAMVGCAGLASGPKLFVQTQHDDDIAFNNYARYAWVRDDAARVNPVFRQYPELPGLIGVAVDRELAAKGFEKSPAETADFLVAMSASVQDVVVISKHRYQGWSHGYNRAGLSNVNTANRMLKMAEGTLMLEIIDVASEGVVWQSRAAGVVARHEGIEKTVDAAVSRMLEKFPPQS